MLSLTDYKVATLLAESSEHKHMYVTYIHTSIFEIKQHNKA